jgi:hypothetical protein
MSRLSRAVISLKQLQGSKKMSLLAIKSDLEGLKPEQIRTPNLPIATALQEASDLVRLCRTERVHTALIQVGQSPVFAEVLEQRVDAAREAQSIWVTVRDQTKSSALVQLEKRAGELRSDLLAAGRWNLREDREAQTTLSAIRGGDTVADLVQDLFDLATLYEKHRTAFEKDQSFDAAARSSEAREVASQLSASISEERLESGPAEIRDMRDRAFTYLDNLVSEVRGAARYAFRSEPDLSRRFTSRYRRRLRRAAKSGEIVAEVVEEEAIDEQALAG